MLKASFRAPALAAALGLLAVPLAGLAQPASPGNMAGSKMAASTQKVDVSDAEVQQFAKLYMHIHEIRMDYGKKLKAAKDKKEIASLKKQGGDEIKSAVADSPLSAQRYNAIAKASGNQPKLQQRLKQAIQSLNAGGQHS